MSRLRPFDIKPGSPDLAIKAGAYNESALARIAHINRFSRDVNDIKFYELDMETTQVVRITSKKGIVEVLNANSGSTSLDIGLQHPDIVPEHDKFYVQLSVYSSSFAITPIIIGRGFSGDTFAVQLKNLEVAADWALLYFYYEIVRID